MSLDYIQENERPKSDHLADAELDGLIHEKKREDGLKEHLHRAFIIFLWIAAFCFSLVFVIRVLHFILPKDWCWIADNELQGIDKLIFSGTIGGFIGRYFKRIEKG